MMAHLYHLTKRALIRIYNLKLYFWRGGKAMARPITPTPILKGREVREFDERIKSDLHCPATLVPTPKLEAARKLVLAYDVKGKK
jgi:hypothetical protein